MCLMTIALSRDLQLPRLARFGSAFYHKRTRAAHTLMVCFGPTAGTPISVRPNLLGHRYWSASIGLEIRRAWLL